MLNKGVPSNSNIKYNSKLIDSPILYVNYDVNKYDYDIVILVGDKIPRLKIKLIYDYIYKVNNFTQLNILMLYSLNFYPDDKEKNKNVSDLYYNYRINLKKYIRPNSKILTIGRSIYSITGTDLIDAYTFYDFIFNETYFFSSELSSYIFPVNFLNNFVRYDSLGFQEETFDFYFFDYQIKKLLHNNPVPVRYPKLKIIRVEDTKRFFEEHWNEHEVAYDIETSGLNAWKNEIGDLTMSFDGITGYYLSWKDVNPILLGEFLKNKFQILANGKFDQIFLIMNGVPRDCLHIDFDTLNAGHLLNEMRRNSLKAHAWLFTPYGGYDNELDRYKKKHGIKSNYLKIPQKIRIPYGCTDSCVTFLAYKKMKKQLEEIDLKFFSKEIWNIEKFYYEITIPSLNMFVDIELQGMDIDWNRLKELSKELDDEILKVKNKLCEELGVKVKVIQENTIFGIKEKIYYDVNVDSGQELGLYLEKIGWKNYGVSKTKVKYFLSGDPEITKWKKDSKSKLGAELLEDYRALTTIQKTFVGYEKDNSGFWQYRQSDNKVHSSFLVQLTNSTRNASKAPNLQNQLKKGDWAKKFRSIFITPSKDHFLGEIDYSGFQLRIGCILSNDPRMTEVFTKLSGDMHSMTANEILKKEVSLEEFLKNKKEKGFKEYRDKAKGINFGFEFGAKGYSFAKTTLEKEWPFIECLEYIEQNNLQKALESKIRKMTDIKKEKYEDDFADMKDKEKFAYYWTVGDDIREKFFKTYKGLEIWHKNTHKFASENGFIKSVFGQVRRLPQLIINEPLEYYEENRINSPEGLKHLSNISLNSPVQAFEIAVVSMGMIGVHKEIKELGLKSRICGMVHDSCVMYIHKDEVEIMEKIARKHFELQRPEYKNIPILIEGDLADVYNGEVWGFGHKWIEEKQIS